MDYFSRIMVALLCILALNPQANCQTTHLTVQNPQALPQNMKTMLSICNPSSAATIQTQTSSMASSIPSSLKRVSQYDVSSSGSSGLSSSSSSFSQQSSGPSSQSCYASSISPVARLGSSSMSLTRQQAQFDPNNIQIGEFYDDEFKKQVERLAAKYKSQVFKLDVVINEQQQPNDNDEATQD